ncbi:integrase catalytic domain-containing protein [Trichonephila clavipes]|nr:integrase catalytic domain-containing protein [Trichonephila clavipes]
MSEVVGVEICGSLYLKGSQKSWVVIFTCAIYCTVHLELATSLSTDCFILALRRFIARRGRPFVIFSDNDTNLVGISNELKSVNWAQIEEFAPAKKIRWKLILPSVSWWGGFWERLIRMLNTILRKVLARAYLNQDVVTTALCDAENVLNSRPLTYISEDLDELIALSLLLFSYKRLEKNEYLGQLKDFSKVRKALPIKEEDIMRVGDTNSKRINWSLGKVKEIYPGNDGIVRVVKNKTKLERS